MGKNAITIRCDGHGVPEILDAILKLFPLDTYVEHPVNLMEVMPGDDVETPIWDTYKEIIRKYDVQNVSVKISYVRAACCVEKDPEKLAALHKEFGELSALYAAQSRHKKL